MRTERYQIDRSFRLNAELMRVLEEVRRKRRFIPSECIAGKVALINCYLSNHGLDAVVIGVSGGIDSSVVLGLLSKAKNEIGSPIRRIVALSLPCKNRPGVTNQAYATARGQEISKLYRNDSTVEWHEINLAESFDSLTKGIRNNIGVEHSAWADGQLVPSLRTPTLYYTTALLAEQGFKALVVGTTNRDEGAYLGFFGKASDGMVDLQIISDLHKSEVYYLAAELGLPDRICGSDPSGDVYDGATHLEMIGAPYDFVELYLSLRVYGQIEKVRNQLSPVAREEFELLGQRIEKMHQYNRHKYLAGNPSIHLDLYERAVPGGWRVERTEYQEAETPRRLVGEFALSPELVAKFPERVGDISKGALGDLTDEGVLLDGLLSTTECLALVEEVRRQKRVPVGINGIAKDYCQLFDRVGSFRATAYSEELANILWARIREHIPQIRVFDDLSLTDSEDTVVWRAVGVNPALRFIWYERGGLLIPHYDAPFNYPDGRRRTLMSLVIYLTPSEDKAGGATRFLLDTQRNHPWYERDYSDRTKMAEEAEVLFKISPNAGSAAVFDHRLLHDAESWSGRGPKIVMRTDVVFEKVILPGITAADSTKNHRVAKSAEVTDRFFGRMLQNGATESELIQAGFFEDRSRQRDRDLRELNFTTLVTPVEKALREGTETASRSTVLITTGGMCPLHQGHISMMERAREALSRKGANVIAGYIAPDHDQYARGKCKHLAVPAEMRVAYCREATANSEWLMVDPYPSLYVDRSLNYTELIVRMERFLGTHIRSLKPMRVSYVCGSDNQGFYRAFQNRGELVVVGRKGADFSRDIRASNRGRIVLVEVGGTPDISSRALRADPTLISGVERGSFLQSIPQRRRIFLRDEGESTLSHWIGKIDREEILPVFERFKSKLAALLRESFELGSVELVKASEQSIKRSQNSNVALISLDPGFPADYQLQLSRVFSICDSVRLPGVVARPGAESLTDQISNIPLGKYDLVDDDIATGKTIREAIRELGPKRRVRSIYSLLESSTGTKLNVDPYSDQDIVDVGDIKDFLFGARDGGLVVRLPNRKVVRVPYVLPFVALSERMSLPVEVERSISYAIWSANFQFFESLRIELKVRDCQRHVVELAEYLGFDREVSLSGICKAYISLLNCNSMPADEVSDQDLPFRTLGPTTECQVRSEI